MLVKIKTQETIGIKESHKSVKIGSVFTPEMKYLCNKIHDLKPYNALAKTVDGHCILGVADHWLINDWMCEPIFNKTILLC